MIDSLVAMEERFRELGAAARLGLAPGDYLLVTLHRPALVDGPMLSDVLTRLSRLAQRLPVVFPVHPRTRKRMAQIAIDPRVRLIDPVGYLEFLSLEADAAGVLTDSGGVQEETTYLGIPCFTLRDNTERPVTVRAGTNMLLGLDPSRIAEIPSALTRTNGAVPSARRRDGMATPRSGSRRSSAAMPRTRRLLSSKLPVDDLRMKIWIDLSNSPHPLLFAPIARRLDEAGHDVLLTARDNAQTLQLARERWPDVEVIGGASPRGRSSKVAKMYERIADLRRWAASNRPDVALSHNSYAQIVAARSLRIPAVTAMDFEHQPANHLAFRLATTILVPEMIRVEAIRRQGARPAKVVHYPGLKEELYIGDFEPDREILAKVNAEPRPRIVVVARTAPTRALYHSSSNPLFEAALRTVCSQEGVVCVVLTRHAEQIPAIQGLGLRNCIVPREAVDSRSLVYAADVMIGAGGTMTREAAVMGIPTWTLFAGKTPAVDAWLERRGMLRRLTQPEQLAHLTPRQCSPRTPEELHQRGRALEDVLVRETLAAGGIESARSRVRVRVPA